VSPLFTSTATEKEMNAVNSEADQGLNKDPSRNFHLSKILSNETSPLNKYQTGNLETLNKPGIRYPKTPKKNL
jgi:insulysin